MNILNQDSLYELNDILKHANKGFYLFTTNKKEVQQEVAKNSSKERDNLFIYDWEQDERSYSIYHMEDLVEVNPEYSKFLILNFQLALRKEIDFWNLNLSRDHLSSHGKLWIFGIDEATEIQMMKSAYDFYTFIMMKVRF